MSTEYEWLNTLKPGDKVIESSTGIGHLDSVRTVSKVTATQIIVGSTKYRKSNGWKVGSSGWNSSYLREATPERVQEIAEQRRQIQIANKLVDVRWRQLPLSVLEQVSAILEQHAKESEAADATA